MSEAGINKNAVKERLEKSAEWIKWLVSNINMRAGIIIKKPKWLEESRKLIVDVSSECAKDAEKTKHNMHYMTEAFTLECVEVKVTDGQTGEKLSNFEEVKRQDIILGDRAYGTIQSMEYARKQGAEFVFRLKSNAFNLYDEDGKLVDLSKKIRRMNGSAYKKFDLYYKNKGDDMCVL